MHTYANLWNHADGLDIAMPGPPSRPDYFGKPLLAAIKSGKVSEDDITDKVVRIVYSLAVVGALDTVSPNNSSADVTSDAHRTLARSLAAQSAILLQNTPGKSLGASSATSVTAAAPLLPLDLSAFKGKGHTIALIGTVAKDPGALYGGGGSGSVWPKAPVSVYNALALKLGIKPPAGGAVNCSITANDTDFFITGGTHVVLRTPTPEGCCYACATHPPGGGTEWTSWTLNADDSKCYCHPAGEIALQVRKGFISGACSRHQAHVKPGAILSYSSGQDEAEALALAKAASVVIIVLSQTSHEGADRTSLYLGQDRLVEKVAAANS
jgi:beta-glucosidase